MNPTWVTWTKAWIMDDPFQWLQTPQQQNYHPLCTHYHHHWIPPLNTSNTRQVPHLLRLLPVPVGVHRKLTLARPTIWPLNRTWTKFKSIFNIGAIGPLHNKVILKKPIIYEKKKKYSVGFKESPVTQILCEINWCIFSSFGAVCFDSFRLISAMKNFTNWSKSNFTES